MANLFDFLMTDYVYKFIWNSHRENAVDEDGYCFPINGQMNPHFAPQISRDFPAPP